MGMTTSKPKTKEYGVALVGVQMSDVGPKGIMELRVPITTSFIDYFLKDFDESFVWSLNLTITLRAVWSGEAVLDGEFLA